MLRKVRVLKMIEFSYVAVILTLVALTILGWIWMAVIHNRKGTGYFSYGCLIYAASYSALICRNTEIYFVLKEKITPPILEFTLIISALQLAAIAQFILTYYKHRGK